MEYYKAFLKLKISQRHASYIVKGYIRVSGLKEKCFVEVICK